MKIFKRFLTFFVSLFLIFSAASCELFLDETEEKPLMQTLQSFKLSDTRATISVGEIKYISFTYYPITWIFTSFSYDKSIIEVVESSLSGMVIKGIAEGQSSLSVSANGQSANCIVTVSGYAETYNAETNPYIYSNTSVLQLSPGSSQKICVSLYGGTVTDIENYSWTIDNSNIASVSPVGQYCVIEAKQEGYTRLKITNPAAAYPYYIGVYVFADATKTTFITSSDNIKTLYVNKGEQTINVDLVNPKTDTYKDKFTYSIIDGDAESINYVSNKNQIIVKPVKAGQCTLRIQNTEADGNYPLDILVRVIELVDGAYIIPSETTVTVSGSELYTISSSINGLTAEKDYATNDFVYEVEDSSICKLHPFAEKCSIEGLQNGSTSIYVSHPKTLRKRQILVIVTNQESGSYDMDCYITTSQNYIKTKVGADTTELKVALKGGSTEDLANFSWKVKESPDAAGKNVINVTPGNSSNSVEYTTRSLSNYVSGTLFINPVSEGTATITVSNPKSYYPTEIMVRVLDENADLSVDGLAYLSTDNNVIRLPSVNSSVNASIKAYGISSTDYDKTEWISNNEDIAKVIGNGTSAEITSLSEGETTITVKNPLSENELTLHVYVGAKYISSTEKIKYISTNTEIIAVTRDSSPVKLTSTLVNGSEDEVQTGFAFSSDDESVAKIDAQYTNGIAYITPVSCGQCEISITHPSTDITKKILVIIKNTAEELNEFKYLSTTNNVITIIEGGTKTVNVSMQNTTDVILDGYSWYSSDQTIAGIQATTTSTATIIGNRKGTALIHCSSSYCSYPIDIIVQVIDASAAATCPYIEATSSVLTLSKSNTWTNVTATLVGGTDSDNNQLEWYSDDKSIIEAYGQNGVGKVRAVGAGITYLRIRHSKAVYDQLVLCICDDGTVSDYSIKVSSGNILSMQPTSGEKSITATLVNGTDADNSNFTWSLDVYDVVDLTYSANEALITPKKEGIAQLTIHHPKSTYDQKVVIKVQQYTSFGFGSSKTSTYVDDTTFVDMQVPTANVNTNVVYSIDNPEIAAINGTNSILAITGRKAGTAIVHAKLMAGTAVYSETSKDLLVTVLPKKSSTKYISASQTIYPMSVGDDRILYANLVGTTNPVVDEYSLHWTVGNPSVLELKGGITNSDGNPTITGNQCYITALSAGETTVTVTHDEVETPLVYHIVVSGTGDITVELNKTYIILDKGTKTELMAMLDNAESDDYKNIEWTADKVDNTNIVSILGSGKTVAVYALKPGTTKVHATFTNGSTAECVVQVNDVKSLTLDTNIWRVRPNETKNFYYTVSPSDATVTAVVTTTDGINYFTCNQTGEKVDSEGRGYFTITGMQESSVVQTLRLTSSEGSYTTASVMVAWNNSIVLDNYSLSGTPDEPYKINYKVSPPDSTLKCTGHTGYMTITEVITKTDDNYREGYLNIVPVQETPQSGLEITLSHINSSTGKIFQKLTIPMMFVYDKYDFKISNLFIDGYFSKYDEASNVFTLSDGDTIAFDLETEQKFVTIEDLRVDNSTISDKATVTIGSNKKTVTIKNIEKDRADPVYKITKLRYPSGDSWNSSNWKWVLGNDVLVSPEWIYGDSWWNLYCGSTFYGKVKSSIDSSVIEYSEYSNNLSKTLTTVTPMYFSQQKIENYPYLYQKQKISDSVSGVKSKTVEEGPLAINSNASLTNASGVAYKAPASSGVLSAAVHEDDFPLVLTITTSSGKIISRTLYVTREYHMCSRNDDDLKDN